MDKIRMKGNWNIFMGKLKQLVASLTDDDLLFFKGKEEELIGKTQRKIGKTRQEIRDLSTRL